MEIKGKKAIVFGAHRALVLRQVKIASPRPMLLRVSRDPNKAGNSIDGIRLLLLMPETATLSAHFLKAKEK